MLNLLIHEIVSLVISRLLLRKLDPSFKTVSVKILKAIYLIFKLFIIKYLASLFLL